MQPDRPTFHESWYRVAQMRPKLRPAVQIVRQVWRNQVGYVVQDPTGQQFFRLSESAYEFVALLDGHRTVAEVWDSCNGRLGDHAPTQGEAIQLLGQLYTANLLSSMVSADVKGLFERYRRRRQREISSYLMNILFARIPLWDPDAFLDRWVSWAGLIFSRPGFIGWLLLLVLGLVAVLSRSQSLLDQGSAQSLLSSDNLLWLYLAFAFNKLLHELGHAFSCKHFAIVEHGRVLDNESKNSFPQTGEEDVADKCHHDLNSGGRTVVSRCHNGLHLGGGGVGGVHAIGIMLLVGVPTPYVDASSSWLLKSKWRRAMIGAAGMYVELGLAAIAAIVWRWTGPGPVHALAYNMMFVASVSTVLFNANPLLRYDGYYILSDLLELPNLAQRGKDYLHYLVKKFAYGVKRLPDPTASLGMKQRGRTWLIVYAIASGIYRLFVGVMIAWYISEQFFLLGIVLALASVVGWVVMPIGKWIHYLAWSPQLHRCRRRAAGASAAFVLAIVIGLGLVPVTDHGRAEGIVEPVKQIHIHAQADGILSMVRPMDAATPVHEGDILVQARNPELESKVRSLEAQLRHLEVKHRQSLMQETALSQSYREQCQAVKHQLNQAQGELARLTIRASLADVSANAGNTSGDTSGGTSGGELGGGREGGGQGGGGWVCFDGRDLVGLHVKRGQYLGTLIVGEKLQIVAEADQSFGPRIQQEVGSGGQVEIKLKGRPDVNLTGRVTQVVPSAQEHLPSPSLTVQAGGMLAIKESPSSTAKVAEPVFEIRIDPQVSDQSPLLPGQRVVVRFAMDKSPLAWQWIRSLRQLIQKRWIAPPSHDPPKPLPY